MTITLLMIFFLYNTGWYAMYLLSAKQVKREVKAYIRSHPGEADVVFSFNLAEGKVADKTFYWEDDGHEFSYQGAMYDVISTQQKDGKLIVKCIDDKKEKELKALMAKMNRKARAKAGFSFSPFSVATTIVTPAQPVVARVPYNLTREDKLSYIKLPLPVPPPDLA